MFAVERASLTVIIQMSHRAKTYLLLIKNTMLTWVRITIEMLDFIDCMVYTDVMDKERMERKYI